MKKIIVVLNELSGNSEKVDEAKAVAWLSHEFEVLKIYRLKNKNDGFELDGCDAVAVFGGDGTLNSVLRKLPENDIEILYCPSGTLNDFAKNMKRNGQNPVLSETGQIAGRRFSYVAAAGTFTAIGTKISSRAKKRVKFLAYFGDVLKYYKVAHIEANIKTDCGDFSGVYTLIMFLDSNRCFGFRFNKLFELNDGNLHMLLMRAPKGKGIFAKIKIFFPMFRVFFLGVEKEIRSKNLTFVRVSSATVSLGAPQSFCLDGESQVLEGDVSVKVKPLSSPIKLIKT